MQPERAWRRRKEEASVTALPDGDLSSSEVDQLTDTDKLAFECLKSAMDRIAEGVVVSDASGRIVFRNAQAKVLGRSRDGDVLAETAIKSMLSGALAGENGTETLDLYSPSRHTLVIRSFPLSANGELCGAVAVVDDVSERKRVEAMRRDFVANVSHELKTPVGALSLLAETIDGEEDPEVLARLASRITVEAHRLKRTIDDLLDLSRIEVDENLMLERVSIKSLIEKVVEDCTSSSPLNTDRVVIQPIAGDLMVTGTRLDLVSAVANLVENALKYSDASSTISITAERNGSRIEIAVSDNGIGIPTREQKRIFERFYRVDRARSRSTGGTGLGLSIVRHVAANHGGDVQVVSIEGEGSTFTLSIPAEREGTLND